MINLNNKKFKTISNSENGELATDFVFHYQQRDTILTCSYKGVNIIEGHLLGIVSENNTINITYHQVNNLGKLKTGTCHSKIVIQSSGKIRIEENWQWTSGDK